MKITGLKIFVANASRTNFVFVKLYTDEGIDGVGEATLEWKTLTVVAALEELERVLIGRDPFAVDATIERLHRDSYWRTGAVFRTALGAVEAAMLDIKGKALGVPVFELLGGKYRDRVACYANHWFCGRPHARRIRRERRVAAVAMGYRALKWDPFDVADLEMDQAQRRATIAIVEAVRAAVGPDIELMLDVHGRLNVPTAIAMCRALAPYDLHLDRGADPAREHRRAGRGPRREPGADRRRRALVRARPRAGGAREEGRRHPAARRLARRRPRRDQAHRPYGARAPDPGGAAQPGRPGDERDDAAHRGGDPQLQDLRDGLDRRALAQASWCARRLRFEDGAILAPTAPGLGVELIEEACARFPYAPYDVPIFDGTMNTGGVANGAETLTGER